MPIETLALSENLDLCQALDAFRERVPAYAEALRAVFSVLNGEKKAIDFPQFPFLKGLKATDVFKQKLQRLLQISREAFSTKYTMSELYDSLTPYILAKEIICQAYPTKNEANKHELTQLIDEVFGLFFTPKLKKTIFGALEDSFKVISQAIRQAKDLPYQQEIFAAFYAELNKTFQLKNTDKNKAKALLIESLPWLLEQIDGLLQSHLGKNLTEKGVKILDIHAETGTIQTALLSYLSIDVLAYKYSNDLYAHTHSLVTYLLFHQNISGIFEQKTGIRQSFEHLIFSDSLKYISATQAHLEQGVQQSLFSKIPENTARMLKQSHQSFTVMLSDLTNFTAYNQAFYKAIERTAQGIVAFVCPRNAIESLALAGFRQQLSERFTAVYLYDGGEWVFIVGVKSTALPQQPSSKERGLARGIFYTQLPDPPFIQASFRVITPDHKHNWLHQVAVEFEDFIPFGDENKQKRLFRTIAKGIKVKDESIFYAQDEQELGQKIHNYLAEKPQENPAKTRKQKPVNLLNSLFETFVPEVKPMRDTAFDKKKIQLAAYRPFQYRYCYADFEAVNASESLQNSWGKENYFLVCCQQPFSVFITQNIPDIQFLGKNTLCAPLYQYTPEGKQESNLTTWGLVRFQKQYEPTRYELRDSLQYNLKQIRSYAEFENCQVEPELASIVGQYVYFLENNVEVKNLQNAIESNFYNLKEKYSIKQGKKATRFYTAFEIDWEEARKEYDKLILAFHRLHNEFEKTAKRFAQIGKKQARSKESYDVLNQYFTQATLAFQHLSKYFEWRITTSEGENIFTELLFLETSISPEAVLVYSYAILHTPAYRHKYASNLARELPRVPLLPDFWNWVKAGARLLALQLQIQSLTPTPLSLGEVSGLRLRLDKVTQSIYVGDEALLQNIPAEIWAYFLGNKSVIEWYLSKYLSKKVKEMPQVESIDKDSVEKSKEIIKIETQAIIDLIWQVVQVQQTLQTYYLSR